MMMVAGGARSSNECRQFRQCSRYRVLVGAGTPSNGHRRRAGVAARSEDSLDDLRRMMHAHEDDERLGHSRLRPVDRVHIVSRDKRDDGSMLAMRERHACVGGDTERGSDARDNFEGNTRLG